MTGSYHAVAQVLNQLNKKVDAGEEWPPEARKAQRSYKIVLRHLKEIEFRLRHSLNAARGALQQLKLETAHFRKYPIWETLWKKLEAQLADVKTSFLRSCNVNAFDG